MYLHNEQQKTTFVSSQIKNQKPNQAAGSDPEAFIIVIICLKSNHWQETHSQWVQGYSGAGFQATHAKYDFN